MKNSRNKKIVVTRKELKSMLITKLNALQVDVNSVSEEAGRYLSELKKAKNDQRSFLMDLYAGDHAPVKVTDYSGVPKRECDMTGEMIDFSKGFEKYISSLEKEYAAAKKRRKEAIRLFTMVLSLKLPYSRILYLRYYWKLSPEDTSNKMHIARSTLFRKQNAAISQLSELFAERNGIIIKSDK